MTRTPLQLSSMVLLAVLLAVGGGMAILSAVDTEHGRTAQGLSPEGVAQAARPSTKRSSPARTGGVPDAGEPRRSVRSAVAQDARTPWTAASGESRTIEGTLIELDGGAPVAGARIAAGDESFVAEADSDANGAFTLIVPADANPPFSVRCAGYAPLHRPPAAAGEALVFELQREGRIAGVIEGPAREVAEGAPVLLFHRNQGPAGRLPLAQTAVDAAGAFGFGELEGGEYQVCVTVEGFSFEFASGLEVRRGQLCEVRLRPAAGGVLRGRVVYLGSGEPVGGATVSASPTLQGLAKVVLELAECSTQTGADGSYELGGLAPGEATVSVETEWGGRVRGTLLIEQAGQEKERDFRLKDPASLAGRVLTSDGEAAAGAQVKVSWEGPKSITDLSPDVEQDSAQAHVLVTSTDSNGRYAFPQLPAGRSLHLLAMRGPKLTRKLSKAQERSMLRALQLGPAEERLNHDIQLQTLTRLVGVVTRRGGKRIPNARLEVALHYSKKKGATQLHSVVESNRGGRFQIPGLLPGTYVLRGSAGGFLENELNFTVEPEEAERPPLKLLLSRGGGLHGVVVDARGNSVPRATVTASATFETNGRRSFQSRADDAGRFEFLSLPRGRYRVSARAHNQGMAGGAGLFAETDAAAAIHLELAPNSVDDRCTIVGRVLASDGGDLKGLEILRLRSGVFRRAGEQFEIQGVRPGRVPLNFTAPGYLKPKVEDLALVPGMRADIGLVEFHPAGELDVYVRDGAGNGFARVRPNFTLVRHGGYGQTLRRVPLFGLSGPHRWQGEGSVSRMRAMHSDQVPFGIWKLALQLDGHEPWSRELVFDAGHRKHTLHVQLEADRDPLRTAKKKAKNKKQSSQTAKKK